MTLDSTVFTSLTILWRNCINYCMSVKLLRNWNVVLIYSIFCFLQEILNKEIISRDARRGLRS